jgi:hypothetical protein
MDSFYFDLATAAQWIWDRRNEPQYWEWEDLTNLNPAPDSLKLNEAVAWNICTVLESKGLVHAMEPFDKNGKKVIPFRIDLSDAGAWKRIRKPPTVCNRLIAFGGALWRKFYLFVIGLLSVGVTSVCVYAIERWIDITWPAPK